MTKVEVIARLRAHEPALRALGIERLSLFGSIARGDQREDSDVDLAAMLNYETVRQNGPFAFFGYAEQIAEMLGAPVDLVTEPTRKKRFQAEIDRDRVYVF